MNLQHYKNITMKLTTLQKYNNESTTLQKDNNEIDNITKI